MIPASRARHAAAGLLLGRGLPRLPSPLRTAPHPTHPSSHRPLRCFTSRRQHDDGWWEGVARDSAHPAEERGHFPASYVELLETVEEAAAAAAEDARLLAADGREKAARAAAAAKES